MDYAFDVQYTQLIRVPAVEIPAVLGFIADWLMDPPAPVSFPYELLGLCVQKGERDTRWWHYILAQTEQLGDPELVSEERWHEVAAETGYLVDNGEEGFRETFRKATEKAASHPSTIDAYPYTQSGLDSILRDMGSNGWAFRYNVRTESPEFLPPGATHWFSTSVKSPGQTFRGHIRSTYILDVKSRPPWEPLQNRHLFDEWFDILTGREPWTLYDPLGDIVRGWAQADPLPTPAPGTTPTEQHSLLLSLFAIPDVDEKMSRFYCAAFLHVELRMFDALYRRLSAMVYTGQHQVVHFPHLPVFVGARGVGKTRFCRSLAMDETYHVEDVTLGDPPKEVGEKSQIGVVVEFSELDGDLNPEKKQHKQRAWAKKYIGKDKFQYRAAHAPGSRADTYFMAGLHIGTTNRAITCNSETDGLRRRLVHLPVSRHPRFHDHDTLPGWNEIWTELLPRVMARAHQRTRSLGSTAGHVMSSDKVIDPLYIGVTETLTLGSDGRWQPVGAEFPEDYVHSTVTGAAS